MSWIGGEGVVTEPDLPEVRPVGYMVRYTCDGVPYGRHYERFRWLARLKAWWLRRDHYYADATVFPIFPPASDESE